MSDWKNAPPYSPGDWIAAQDVQKLHEATRRLIAAANAAFPQLCDISSQGLMESDELRAAIDAATVVSSGLDQRASGRLQSAEDQLPTCVWQIRGVGCGDNHATWCSNCPKRTGSYGGLTSNRGDAAWS